MRRVYDRAMRKVRENSIRIARGSLVPERLRNFVRDAISISRFFVCQILFSIRGEYRSIYIYYRNYLTYEERPIVCRLLSRQKFTVLRNVSAN